MDKRSLKIHEGRGWGWRDTHNGLNIHILRTLKTYRAVPLIPAVHLAGMRDLMMTLIPSISGVMRDRTPIPFNMAFHKRQPVCETPDTRIIL